MSTVYSAHPALAAEQLQRAELETANGRTNSHNRRHHCSSSSSSSGASGKTTKPTPKKYMSRVCNTMAGSAATEAAAVAVADKITTARMTTESSMEVLGSLPVAQPSHQSTGTTKYAETDSCIQLNDTTERKPLPDRTNYAAVDDDDISDEDDDDYGDAKAADANQKVADSSALAVDEDIIRNTKDCVNQQMGTDAGHQSALVAMSNDVDVTVVALDSIDETDHVSQRFSSRNSRTMLQRGNHRTYAEAKPQEQHQRTGSNGSAASDGVIRESQCVSGLSSGVSSPSASTVSSPLSTPTRLAPLQILRHSHEHCCQKAAQGQQQQHHQRQLQQQNHLHHHHKPHSQHNQQQQQPHKNHKMSATCCGGSRGSCGGSGGGGGNDAGSTSGCKSKKLDPRLSPSPYRQLLPIVLCILSFAAVFATLIVYMDTTEIRHQQFRLNMSRDYELNGVAQDDPALIAFLRQIHMRKYPMHFLKNREVVNAGGGVPAVASSVNSLAGSGTESKYMNFTAAALGELELEPMMAHYVAHLVGSKTNGAVIQSLTGSLANLISAPWLSETLDWMGILVEPEPRWYFTLRKENAQRSRMQVVHACVSPNPYPKEITIHNEDVRINSLQEEETSWFNSRVKCFPLYTIMLACDRIEYDLLSLGVQGQELEILQTLPFDKVKIDVISIHLLEDHEDVHSYAQSITKFMAGKSYKLLRKFGRNYFYQRQNSVSRTRKKDILLLKTP